MIVTKIIGGLGNQMFQYAAGRSLALANGSRLKLDISGFRTYELHNRYELDLFNIDAEIATPEDVAELAGPQSRFSQFISRKLKLNRKTHILDSGYLYKPGFFEIKAPAYLDGYWQSYQYLQPFAGQLKEDFTFKAPLTGDNLEMAGLIKRTNSVSIHVRRGDYLSNPTFSKIHGGLETTYYRNAIQKIHLKVAEPHFFVFSNDLDWARDNLGLGNDATFVSYNTGRFSYEDMRLMALCKHNIIANSTFSWWGAWLNNNPGKVVIAPLQWFADRTVVANFDEFVGNLIPQTWVLE